jgi:hypothetical protein
MNHTTLGIAIALAITTLMIASMNLSTVQRAHAQLFSQGSYSRLLQKLQNQTKCETGLFGFKKNFYK